MKPSPPNGEEYSTATWTGISGDAYYRNFPGADTTTITNEWLDTNIRAKGPLGKHYPRFMFIMEGDTPSFLGLTNNGLNSYRNPGWGGWGGRYVYRSRTARRTRSGRRAATPRASVRGTRWSVRTASGTPRTRRPSGAGAKRSSTISPRAWTGR